MGTTLTTLSLYGVNRSVIEPMLAPSDLLREQNLPWITIVPVCGTDGDNISRLCKLAKKLTNEHAAIALLFLYFDDELFHCDLYSAGRKAASCGSDLTWIKFGKKLNDLFGDDLPAKALRYASHCTCFEEQLKLLEETIGAALYDMQNEQPRIVERGDSTLRTIKLREAMLRKRPNKYSLSEVPRKDWPNKMKIRQKLLELLQPQWQRYSLSTLLYNTDIKEYFVPGADGLVAYPYSDNENRKDYLLLYNENTDDYQDIGPLPATCQSVVWITKSGNLVVLYAKTVKEQKNDGSWSQIVGSEYVSCIKKDGTECWRFEPELSNSRQLYHIHSSSDGVVTLFSPATRGIPDTDALIWQINAETGELLRLHHISANDEAVHLIYAESINSFIYCCRSTNELVVIDSNLDKEYRLAGYFGNYYIGNEQICGDAIWNCWDSTGIRFFNLRNGEALKVNFEIPAYAIAVFSNGLILCTNESQKKLIVLDKSGKVVSRFSFAGIVCRAFSDGNKIFIVEQRGPNPNGLVYDELFNETSTHVWELVPFGCV